MFLNETNPFSLLFIGDSITDCGRDYATRGVDLADGYVRQVDVQLRAQYPQLELSVLNMGVSGNRVTDLEDRWESDMEALQPDYLSIMIGINDVWRHFDSPDMEQVSLEVYRRKLSALVDRAIACTKGVLLCSPFYLETDLQDPMRAQMDAYRAAALEIALERGLHFVDVQEAFDDWMQHQPASALADDKVHPNLVGHQIIASSILRVIGASCTS